MLRTTITEKQYELPQKNDLTSGFSLEHVDPLSIIMTMIKIIKTKYKDRMDENTHVQFLKIADSVIRMTEEIKA